MGRRGDYSGFFGLARAADYFGILIDIITSDADAMLTLLMLFNTTQLPVLMILLDAISLPPVTSRLRLTRETSRYQSRCSRPGDSIKEF